MNSKNNIQILLGRDGIISAYEKSLEAKSLDIICLSQNYARVLGEWFDKSYVPKLFKSEIKTREILGDNADNRSYASKKDKQKNQVAFLFDDVKNETDFIVSDDFVILVSFNPNNPFAIVIDDKETIAGMKSKFEIIWNSALK